MRTEGASIRFFFQCIHIWHLVFTPTLCIARCFRRFSGAFFLELTSYSLYGHLIICSKLCTTEYWIEMIWNCGWNSKRTAAARDWEKLKRIHSTMKYEDKEGGGKMFFCRAKSFRRSINRRFELLRQTRNFVSDIKYPPIHIRMRYLLQCEKLPIPVCFLV